MPLFRAQPKPLPVAEDVPAGVLVSVRDIEKSYAHGPGRTYVLRRVTFDVREGSSC